MTSNAEDVSQAKMEAREAPRAGAHTLLVSQEDCVHLLLAEITQRSCMVATWSKRKISLQERGRQNNKNHQGVLFQSSAHKHSFLPSCILKSRHHADVPEKRIPLNLLGLPMLQPLMHHNAPAEFGSAFKQADKVRYLTLNRSS